LLRPYRGILRPGQESGEQGTRLAFEGPLGCLQALPDGLAADLQAAGDLGLGQTRGDQVDGLPAWLGTPLTHCPDQPDGDIAIASLGDFGHRYDTEVGRYALGGLDRRTGGKEGRSAGSPGVVG
jgi:hypothetical protein